MLWESIYGAPVLRQWVSLKLSCHPFLPYLTSHPLSISVILTTSPLAVRAQRNILLTPHYNMILFKFNVVVVEASEFLYFRTLGQQLQGKMAERSTAYIEGYYCSASLPLVQALPELKSVTQGVKSIQPCFDNWKTSREAGQYPILRFTQAAYPKRTLEVQSR